MNYYKCQECGQIYTGWGESKICGKCGGILIRISREEFEIYKEDRKGVKSDHKIRS